MTAASPLATAVLQALLGERPIARAAVYVGPLTPNSVTDEVRDCLRELGHTIESVDAIRAERLAVGLVWPFFVPLGQRPGIGAAQLKAALDQVCVELGIGAPPAAVRDGNKAKDAVDARLMAERPPHHGSVG